MSSQINSCKRNTTTQKGSGYILKLTLLNDQLRSQLRFEL
mgnify:CR=1 FL=1